MKFFLIADPEDGQPPITEEISEWYHFCFSRELRAGREAKIYDDEGGRMENKHGPASDPAA